MSERMQGPLLVQSRYQLDSQSVSGSLAFGPSVYVLATYTRS